MLRTLCLVLLIGLLGGSLAAPAVIAQPQPAAPELLAAAIVGKPAVSGDRIAWVEPGSAGLRLVVRDAAAQQNVAQLDVPAGARSLALDRSVVAWVEPAGAQRERVVGYALATGRRWTIREGAAFGELALGNGALAYQEASPAHAGLYLHDLASGAERLLSAQGQAPVIVGAHLLWSEAAPAASYGMDEWSLFLAPLAGGAAQEIARAPGGFGGYGGAGDTIVWSGGLPERQVSRLQLGSGADASGVTSDGTFPAVVGDRIAWVATGSASGWALRLSGGTAPAARSAAPLALWGAIGDRLLVTVDGADARQLLLVDAAGRDQALAPPPDMASHASCPAAPCGQVRVAGTRLIDDGGRWPVHGVQFFLPQYGINSWTFHDGRYAVASADIDRWLDRARDQLAVRTLRIFVELPAGGTAPTSHATVYDFARRAEQRGMRLGIVVQNSSDFAMTGERRAWLTGLASYFAQRNAAHLIAYVSAANEINNWCNRVDCFDQNSAYVDGAVEWVAQVAAVLRGTGILTTVGIATEVADRDGLPAWHDFHRRDSRGRRMADLVDFLAPHNYGGGAYGIINDLRYVLGYGGPIVLEEYGFPTDPRAADARYTEGPASCRDAPLSAGCANTAPYYVELSLRAIRETSYAGGAAWMLADIASKRCGTDPPDLWTGLLAAGAGYCGGTLATAPGAAKSTAHRVLVHHQSWPPPPVPPLFLPLLSN